LAFKKQRKQRQKLATDPVLELPPTDPRRKAFLRDLFIKTARKYIGVPYGLKHHDPVDCKCEGCSESGRQLGQERMSLDCCGLVRKVAREMSGVLGFRLGRGNQSYQYDTLPLRVDSALKLEPGDLVFYSGTYLNPLSKPHPFHMTHVEIFIGGATGEATIGSRERQKWVMEYDSYAFKPKRWTLIQHFYVKIDTWLEGVCVPAHPGMWRDSKGGSAGGGGGEGGKPPASLLPSWDTTRYSVFAAGGEEDEDGDDAGDD